MWTWFHKLASPPHAYRIVGRLAPWFGWPALILILTATYWGLVRAPADYQQGDAFRILYVHAPAAWMSMFIYVTMAIAAGVGLIWRIKLAHAAAAASAPTRRGSSDCAFWPSRWATASPPCRCAAACTSSRR